MKNKINKLNFNELSLVVFSSESYSYLWGNFIRTWQKYCSNFKIEKFLITTNESKNLKNFTILSSKLDKDDFWSKRIKYGLKKIKSKNLLVFTDDCFMSETLDINNFKKIYSNFKKKKNVTFKTLSTSK